MDLPQGARGTPQQSAPGLHRQLSHLGVPGGGPSIWVGHQGESSILLHPDTVRLRLREHLASSEAGQVATQQEEGTEHPG